MGFSSFLCSKSGSSIPAFPDAGEDIKESRVIVVMPDNSTYEFIWDGYMLSSAYSMFDEVGRQLPDNFESLWTLYNKYKKDYLNYDPSMHWPKRITIDGKETVIDQFNWEEPLAMFDGKTLNELNRIHKVEHADEVMYTLFKIVKKYNYNGEKFDELSTSESCPFQGFFYETDFSPKEDLRKNKEVA